MNLQTHTQTILHKKRLRLAQKGRGNSKWLPVPDLDDAQLAGLGFELAGPSIDIAGLELEERHQLLSCLAKRKTCSCSIAKRHEREKLKSHESCSICNSLSANEAKLELKLLEKCPRRRLPPLDLDPENTSISMEEIKDFARKVTPALKDAGLGDVRWFYSGGKGLHGHFIENEENAHPWLLRSVLAVLQKALRSAGIPLLTDHRAKDGRAPIVLDDSLFEKRATSRGGMWTLEGAVRRSKSGQVKVKKPIPGNLGFTPSRITDSAIKKAIRSFETKIKTQEEQYKRNAPQRARAQKTIKALAFKDIKDIELVHFSTLLKEISKISHERHFFRMAVAGFLGRLEISEKAALSSIQYALAAHQEAYEDSLPCVRDTYRKIEQGQKIIGAKWIKSKIGQTQLDALVMALASDLTPPTINRDLAIAKKVKSINHALFLSTNEKELVFPEQLRELLYKNKVYEPEFVKAVRHRESEESKAKKALKAQEASLVPDKSDVPEPVIHSHRIHGFKVNDIYIKGFGLDKSGPATDEHGRLIRPEKGWSERYEFCNAISQTTTLQTRRRAGALIEHNRSWKRGDRIKKTSTGRIFSTWAKIRAIVDCGAHGKVAAENLKLTRDGKGSLENAPWYCGSPCCRACTNRMLQREMANIDLWPPTRRIVADKKERQALIRKAKRQNVTSYRWFNRGDLIAIYIPEREAKKAKLAIGETFSDKEALKIAVAQDALFPAQSFEEASKEIDALPEQPFLIGRADTNGGDRTGGLLPFSGARKNKAPNKTKHPTSALGSVIVDEKIVAIYPKALSSDEAKAVADSKHDAVVFGQVHRELLIEGAPIATITGKKPQPGGLILTEKHRMKLPDLLQLSENALSAWPAILTALLALIADRATLPERNQIFLSENQLSYLDKLDDEFEAFFEAGGSLIEIVPQRTRKRSATAA